MDVLGTFYVGVKSVERKETTFCENKVQCKTDGEMQKYGYRIGLETLVVHTVTYEYFWKYKQDVFSKANAAVLRLGTTVARLKLKGIGGGLVNSGGAWGLIRINAPHLTSF